jgi:filamentous hemagglutinin
MRWLRPRSAITFDESRAGHIFRRAPGHFQEDTATNRRVLLAVAANPANLQGVDRFGMMWAAQTMPDGTQLWVQLREGRITNGGVNERPRHFDPSRGLSGSSARGG